MAGAQAGLVVEGASSGLDGGDRTRFVRFAPGRSTQVGGKFGEKRGGCHAQAHMAMPSVPGAGFAMIEPRFFLRALEAFLDRPAQTGRAGEFGQRGACP